MGHLHRSHRRLPTYTYPPSVAKIPQVLPQKLHLPVYQPPFRPDHGPIDFHQHGRGSVLIASDNTSMVSYRNNQGGIKSAELCALMWRILTRCSLNNVTLRHVPGSLNVIADGLSRRNQIQPPEWSLSPQIFKQISKIWESPQVDLFATSLNTKLPL